MQAINPFLVLGVDEAASREEIDAAFHALVKQCHPDRFVSCSTDEQADATDRMAEVTYAYELLTDPVVAARHKDRFDRVRAAGVPVAPAPRPTSSPPPPRPATSSPAPPRDYRVAASSEFTVGPTRTGTPWTARRGRRWFGRR